MNAQAASQLAGIHRLKPQVTGLARLGHRAQIEFVEQRQLMDYVPAHSNGGMPLSPRLDMERAKATAGLGYPALGVPGRETMEHPGGHEIRFCTHQDHTGLDPDAVTTINDPRGRRRAARAGCHAAEPGNQVT